MSFYRCDGDAILIDLRVTPKASRDGVDGVSIRADGRARLSCRVRAVPDKGAANKAVCELIAGTLGLPKTSVSLSTGSTMRDKTVRIEKGDDEIIAALDRLAC